MIKPVCHFYRDSAFFNRYYSELLKFCLQIAKKLLNLSIGSKFLQKTDTKFSAKAFYIAIKTFRNQPSKYWNFINGTARENKIFIELEDYDNDNDDVDDDDYDDDDYDDYNDDYDEVSGSDESDYIIERKSILKDLKKKKPKVYKVLFSTV